GRHRPRPPAGGPGRRPPPGRAGPQGRPGPAGRRAVRPPLRPPRAPGHGAGRHVGWYRAGRLPLTRRPGAGRRCGADGRRLLVVGRPPPAAPRGPPGVPVVSSRLLVAAGLAGWLGATLLLSGVRWFARPPLVERLRPYLGAPL